MNQTLRLNLDKIGFKFLFFSILVSAFLIEVLFFYIALIKNTHTEFLEIFLYSLGFLFLAIIFILKFANNIFFKVVSRIITYLVVGYFTLSLIIFPPLFFIILPEIIIFFLFLFYSYIGNEVIVKNNLREENYMWFDKYRRTSKIIIYSFAIFLLIFAFLKNEFVCAELAPVLLFGAFLL